MLVGMAGGISGFLGLSAEMRNIGIVWALLAETKSVGALATKTLKNRCFDRLGYRKKP